MPNIILLLNCSLDSMRSNRLFNMLLFLLTCKPLINHSSEFIGSEIDAEELKHVEFETVAKDGVDGCLAG